MDFFQRLENARRKTKWLIFYFGISTLLTILAVYLVFEVAYVIKFQSKRIAYEQSVSLWNPKLFLWVTSGTLLVVVTGCLYKIAELSGGGATVATSLGGQLLNINSSNPAEKRLRNVVEEMAIASGVPVPQIYLLPQEDGINAFAAGFTTSDAVIGVTRGAMEKLSRDELQGVIGHEFSHILNGDMRLNMRLIGVLSGILCIGLCGKILINLASDSGSSRSSRNDGRLALFLIGAALLAVGGIGMLFGRLIKSAISRQREFLADASAVQFTRNPLGLSGALKKIGGAVHGSRLDAPNAEEASHLFFGNALENGWTNLMATHPPLKERIRALEPGWDGKYSLAKAEGLDEISRPVGTADTPIRSAFPLPMPGNLVSGKTQPISQFVKLPTPRQVACAAELRTAIPGEVRATARQSLGACTIVYSLLLSDNAAGREAQLMELRDQNDDGVLQETNRVFPTILALDPRLKLPLVNLCLPALRQLSKAQYLRFADNIRLLIESDRTVFLFEYMFQKIVLRHLDPTFNPVRKSIVQYYVLKPLEEDAFVLISALARHGSENNEQRANAFKAGVEHLKLSGEAPLIYSEEKCDLPQIDAALNRLAQAAPMVKKIVLNACACAVAADGVVQMKEAEMLRAIADSLDCPIPPFVENV